MGNSRREINKYLEGNKLKILSIIIFLALINAVISLLFQKIGYPLLGIIPITIISYYYLLQMYRYVNKILDYQSLSIRDFFKDFKLDKKVVIIILSYVGWAVLSFIVLRLVAINPKQVLLAILLLFIMFSLSNAVNHLYYFSYETLGYAQVIKTVLRDYRTLGLTLLKTLVIMIQGAFITIAANVFIYGPQIVDILEMDEKSSTYALKQLFSNDISSVIQSTGVQAIVLYALFMSAVIYGVYAKKNGIKNTSN